MQCSKCFIFFLITASIFFIVGLKIIIDSYVDQSNELHTNVNHISVRANNLTHTFKTAALDKVPGENICPKVVCKRLPCKEESVPYGGSFPRYSMDDVSLNHHVTVKRNSTGHLTYFEIRFAVQMRGWLEIELSQYEGYSGFYCDLFIGTVTNYRTRLYFGLREVENIETPDVLSSAQFKTFYIKIDDGKLQFGNEGDSTPFTLSHSDARFGLLNYYRFKLYGGPGTFRYCPAAEELHCKEEIVSYDNNTQEYSMNSETVNHVALKRDSSGHRTYFELHFALETAGPVGLLLSNNDLYWENSYIQYTLWLGHEDNQKTELTRNGVTVQKIDTPNILSSTQFRAFYIKIDGGNLQFGREGDSAPLISYSNANLGLLNYYYLYLSKGANIRYCPVEGNPNSNTKY